MRDISWSERARFLFEGLWETYMSKSTEEERKEYESWVFGNLLNAYELDEYGLHFRGYWRAPLIQKRIAKMWRRRKIRKPMA